MAVDPARAKTLFLQASDLADPADRAAYLDGECGDDAELRDRVEALLAADGPSGPVLEAEATNEFDPSPAELPEATQASASETMPGSWVSDPVTGLATLGATGVHSPDGTLAHAPPVARPAFTPGQVIGGRYTLLEVLGEGGMGTVYKAGQSQPVKRQVALKLIKLGMDSRTVLARFDAERQALAMMDHPNIARVYDGGATEAHQPYFVMEFVHGVPITEYCDRHRLSVDARLQLFVAVCQAVQHAHQKGIIHRDLKPSNVMVTEVDGRPTPKVIDFGVAKATEFSLTDQTLGDTGAIVGTPTYMSPEQADPSTQDIDTRTDVYALGVILYELLAGSTPLDANLFKRGALLEMLRMVREVDPSKPSTKVSTADALPSIAANRGIDPGQLSRELRGDLDWIVMKALEKDRTRRYETANGFAADILRHLASEPVQAAPPSRIYRTRKFVRKHRRGVIAASLVLVALVVGMIGTTWGLFRADRARRAEVAQRFRAEDRETQAIDAVKRYRDAVAGEPELKNSPALEALRKRLLKGPLVFFRALRDRLQADEDTRPESLARLAQASFDLGVLTQEIGDQQDALIAHRESLAIRRKLADANPTVTEMQIKLATSHSNIGLLLRDTGKPAEALKAHESALAIHQKLADANPNVTEYQSNLAMSHYDIGYILSDTGKLAEALKAHESALAVRQKLADANPNVTQFQNYLARSHSEIGHLLNLTGKRAESLKTQEFVLAIYQKLADTNPTVTEYQKNLARSYFSIGILLRFLDRSYEAMKPLQTALKVFQKLADANPTVTEFQNLLAQVQAEISYLLNDNGKPAEALKAYESPMAIYRKLAEANPTVTLFQTHLAISYSFNAHLLERIGKLGEAVKGEEQALAIYRKLAEANPTVTSLQKDLGMSHNRIGLLLKEAERPVESLKAHQSALAIYQKLIDATPTYLDLRGFEASTYHRIGERLREIGEPAEAMKAEEAVLAIQQKLAREHIEPPFYDVMVARSLQSMALIDMDENRLQEARTRRRQAIGLYRKVIAANPRYVEENYIVALLDDNQAAGDSEGVAEARRALAERHDKYHSAADLDARLAAIIKGEQQPKDAADRFELASRACDKQLYAMAARLYVEAFAADPKLVDDRQNDYRKLAAGAAALAGTGQGRDVPELTEDERARLRATSREWLRAELSSLTKVSESEGLDGKQFADNKLRPWKRDVDLFGIRDPRELAKLPEAERAAFTQLWADVDELLNKVTKTR